MKTWYLATFKWSDSGVYCTNLVLTDSEEKAEEHYSKYEMVSIRIAWYLSALLTSGKSTTTEVEECLLWSFEQTIRSVTSGTSSPT